MIAINIEQQSTFHSWRSDLSSIRESGVTNNTNYSSVWSESACTIEEIYMDEGRCKADIRQTLNPQIKIIFVLLNNFKK